MKLRILVFTVTAFCMISSCSSCGDGDGNNSGTNSSLSDNGSETNEHATGDHSDGEYSTADLQEDMDVMMQEQIELSNRSKSKGVETIIASFELGMTKREVTKHMLRMKKKKHLVRVKKSTNRYEYVYQLRLASGKSNTYMDFKYARNGGVYQTTCKPSKFRKKSKSAFLAEVHDLLTEWYGAHNFQLPNTKGCARYVWITGNRHIDLHCTSKSVEFIYTDLNIKKPAKIAPATSKVVM
ncbi:MAG: hypothetical protein JKY03_07695 [Aureispira sp.]|nr:hypothetical protein [Aureispira sp.]